MRYKNFLKHIGTYVIVILCCNCKRDGAIKEISSYPDVVYNLNDRKQAYVNEIFEGVEVIPLLFEGTYYPTMYPNLTVTENDYLLFDKDVRLHIFSKEGKYLSCSEERIGNGPEEFQIVMGYAINPYTGLLDVLTPGKLMTYDEKLNFVEAHSIPGRPGNEKDGGLFFSELTALSPTEYLLLPTSVSEGHGKIFKYAKITDETTAAGEYGQDIWGSLSSRAPRFTVTPDSTVYFLPGGQCDYIYTYDHKTNKLERNIGFIKETGTLGKEDLNEPADADVAWYKKLYESGHPITARKFINSRKIFVDVYDGLEDGHTFVIDRKTSEIRKVKWGKGERRVFGGLNFLDEDYGYIVATKEVLMNKPGLLMEKVAMADSILGHYDEDTYFVVKYKIKD